MELRVQLKICEGCGCLWYRAQTQGSVYCHRCEAKLKDFPTPESRKRRGRPGRKVLARVWAVAVERGCAMSAALQLPMVWEAAIHAEVGGRRRGWEPKLGAQPEVRSGNKGALGLSDCQPGFLQKAHGEDAAALSVCVDASGQGAEHSRRSNWAGMGIQPAGAHLRGRGHLRPRC
jgi:hypothetical protein